MFTTLLFLSLPFNVFSSPLASSISPSRASQTLNERAGLDNVQTDWRPNENHTPRRNEIAFPIPSTTTTLFITRGAPFSSAAIDKVLVEAQSDITVRSLSTAMQDRIPELWKGIRYSVRDKLRVAVWLRITPTSQKTCTLELARDVLTGLRLFYEQLAESKGHRVSFRFVSGQGATKEEGAGVIGGIRI
ncbi:MAG: hypothetical protein Q9182_004578 [Xanthomendoza sp. 2 TL-2023]